MSEEHGAPEVLVIGAGQAGLSLSYFLKRSRIAHLVLERDRPFSSWHHRWDGFHANTPSWMNSLPRDGGDVYPGRDRNGFATKQELISYFDRYTQDLDPPLVLGCNVSSIRECDDSLWEVCAGGKSYRAPNVAICTGSMAVPRIPPASLHVSRDVPQIHSSAFRNPSQLQTSEVLIVGSGSSGVQICKELSYSGRFSKIHLSTSDTLVLPRHICGIQVHRFLGALGFFDLTVKSRIGQWMYSGLETRGDPIVPPTPKDLARRYGVRLYGKVTGAESTSICFADGQTLVAADLTIIWCSGYRADFSFIAPKDGSLTVDQRGYPMHERGIVGSTKGLYFVGLRYQYTVTSHDIYGVGRDAEYIASHISGLSARGT